MTGKTVGSITAGRGVYCIPSLRQQIIATPLTSWTFNATNLFHFKTFLKPKDNILRGTILWKKFQPTLLGVYKQSLLCSHVSNCLHVILLKCNRQQIIVDLCLMFK